ncbi:MAG: baseplate J/gp47 family protein [Pirellulales bacterium]
MTDHFSPANDCSGCTPRHAATPVAVDNRPGLAWLSYRAGTFSSFREAMLAALVSQPVRSQTGRDGAPATLTTRDPDDMAVAMLDLWAYVCDVLTLYQEAYLNEGFLRTAQLRESLVQLGRLVGYHAAPAVAARTLLAFSAEAGTGVALPASWPVQSTPEPGSDPVTFETTQPLTLHPAANAVTFLGPPAAAVWRTQGLLMKGAGRSTVTVGTRLVFHQQNSPPWQRVVTRVDPHPWAQRIEWEGALPDLPASSWRVSRLGREFRPFGAHAPESWLVPQPNTNPLSFKLESTAFNQLETDEIRLEGQTLRIGAGTRLLFRYTGDFGRGRTKAGLAGGSPFTFLDPSWTREVTVSEVSTGPATVGPLSGACTIVRCSETLPRHADLRRLEIYELLGNPLEFAATEYATTLPAGSSEIYVADATGLPRGRQILLGGPQGWHVARVSQEPTLAPSSAPHGSPTAPWMVRFTPPVPWEINCSASCLYGNVVSATHGETQRELILGDGDASLEWQEFVIARVPITHRLDATAPGGIASSLQLEVAGQRWQEVESFFGRGPDEPVFVTYHDDQQRLHIRGGDGRTGRRFPSGRENIRVRFRVGAGESGNVAAGRLDVLLKSLPGLQTVTNPVGAQGGAEAEAESRLRENLVAEMGTLGRAVSLRDYEHLALMVLRGGKARASWGDFQDRRGVVLACRPAGGQPLVGVVAELREFLDRRRDANVPLAVREARKIPFVFHAVVHVPADLSRSQVQQAVEQSFGVAEGFLSFARTAIGETVHLARLVAALQRVAGVDWVEVREFSTPLADRAFGQDTTCLDAVYVGPDEIAWPAVDGDLLRPSVQLDWAGGLSAGDVT